MKIRSTLNNGVAEVADDLGAALIASGGWKAAADAPAEPAAARKPRTRKAPVEEPQNEE